MSKKFIRENKFSWKLIPLRYNTVESFFAKKSQMEQGSKKLKWTGKISVKKKTLLKDLHKI